MKEIWFVEGVPDAGAPGLILDLTASASWRGAAAEPGRYIDLSSISRANEERWKQEFIDWLGEINRQHAGLSWWAHSSTAKNFLSSPLGDSLIKFLGLLHVVEQQNFKRLYVLGADRPLYSAFRDWVRFTRKDLFVREIHGTTKIPRWILGRAVYHFFRVLWFFVIRRRHFPLASETELWLFTYVDLNVREGFDAFFGKLPGALRARQPTLRVVFLAYIQAPYRTMLRRLNEMNDTPYWPLFYELSSSDLIWALAKTVVEALTPQFVGAPHNRERPWLRWLLADAFRWDLAQGGYFYNLLVYRAARRFARRHRPRRLIYPYENKSLEKLLLLAVADGHPQCQVVGYQHTSITPRHTTLLFAPGEAACTPLPRKIITVGDITKRFLEENGNYPPDMLVAGCALRQSWQDPCPRRQGNGEAVRVLLALSSSRTELIEGVRFFRSAMEHLKGIELGVRPHPEFPLSLLPADLLTWIRSHARDFTGTSLRDNLQWCDVTAYVSSTVALESLIAGKPVLNFSAGDLVSADPVLDELPFRFRAPSACEAAAILDHVLRMPQAEYESGARRALDYVRAYLRPVCSACLAQFLANEPV